MSKHFETMELLIVSHAARNLGNLQRAIPRAVPDVLQMMSVISENRVGRNHCRISWWKLQICDSIDRIVDHSPLTFIEQKERRWDWLAGQFRPAHGHPLPEVPRDLRRSQLRAINRQAEDFAGPTTSRKGGITDNKASCQVPGRNSANQERARVDAIDVYRRLVRAQDDCDKDGRVGAEYVANCCVRGPGDVVRIDVVLLDAQCVCRLKKGERSSRVV